VIKDIAYDVGFCAVAGFIWWRLIWSIKHDRTDFKGVVTVRQDAPVRYWIGVSMLTIAMLMTSLLAVAFLCISFADAGLTK
jgi:hypothetical protein